MNISDNIFFGGHSLGGAMVQTLSQAHDAKGNTLIVPIFTT
jgi:hypothetical protein